MATGYQLSSYGEMITNEPRTPAYAEALRKAITPGCKVIDIGAGPGLFALLACRYGAGSVVAIEPHNSVELLRAAAAANGFADRIEIFHGLSIDYSSDVPADVIISDLRGCLPLFEAHIPSIVDARQRLLRPGGHLIPMRDILHVALVDHPATYAPYERPWLGNGFDLDLSASHRFVVNQWVKTALDPADLISDPRPLMTLDYTTITNPSAAADTCLTADRPGTAHGFLMWFDAELGPGIGFSNAPGKPEQVYSQTFFPFERPIAVAAGDRIDLAVRADLIEASYTWSWATTARDTEGGPVAYRQSTFLAKILAPKRVATTASTFAPPALPEHAIDRLCLSLFDGKTSLAAIAERLAAEFPDQFKGSAEALTHATRLAGRYRDAPRPEIVKGDDDDRPV